MRYILMLWVLSGALVAAYAQDPPGATLTGRVIDPSNAVVPDVAVCVRNIATNQIQTSRTDRQGTYIFRVLPPGRYSLSVEAPNFEEYHTGLRLNSGQIVKVDIALRISALVEQVKVKAKTPALEAVVETKTWNYQDVVEIWQARESPARDLGEALALLDGVWRIRKGGIANDVVLRGFQQDNLNVLVDGLRIYGACPNNMDPAAFHVDFAEVQKVEVTRGVFDVRNQGSLGGLINIVTKTPSPGFHITPGFSTGSFGYYNPSLTASLEKKRFHGLAGYSLRGSQPYRDGRGKRFTDYANYQDTSRDSQAFDINTAWFKFGVVPGENQHLDFGYTRQRGGQVLYPYLQMDAVYDNADRLNAAYHLDNLSGTLKQLRIESYFTQVRHYMTDELRTTSAGAARPYGMATFAATKALGARVEAEFSGFAAGFESYRRNWNANNTMRMMGVYMDQPAIPDVLMSVAGFYGAYHRLFRNKLWLNVGARLDTASSETRSPGLNTDLYWAYNGTRNLPRRDTNPAGSVWLTYILRNDFEIFAGLGHTVRLPDPQERYFALRRMGSDWVGNPNLQPTQNTEADLGFNYRNRRFTLRPTIFYSDLKNYVTVHDAPRIKMVPGVMNTAARSYANVPARIYGGELNYSLELTRALLLFGGISYSRGTTEIKPARQILSRNLAEMPPLRSRAALRYGNRRFFAEIEGIAVNAQGLVDSDLGEQRTPGYAFCNLKAGVHASKLNLAMGIENLFNRFFYEYFSFQRDPFRLGTKVPEPGRNVFLTVSYAF